MADRHKRSSSYDIFSSVKPKSRQECQNIFTLTQTKPSLTLRELQKERYEYRSRSRSRTRNTENKVEFNELNMKFETVDKIKELENQWKNLKTSLNIQSKPATPNSKNYTNKIRDPAMKSDNKKINFNEINYDFENNKPSSTRSCTRKSGSSKENIKSRFATNYKNDFATRYADLESKHNSEAILKLAQKIKQDLDDGWNMDAIPNERNSPCDSKRNSSQNKLKYFGKEAAISKAKPGESKEIKNGVKKCNSPCKMSKKPSLNIKIDKELLIDQKINLLRNTPSRVNLSKTPKVAKYSGKSKETPKTTTKIINIPKFTNSIRPSTTKNKNKPKINYQNAGKKPKTGIETPKKRIFSLQNKEKNSRNIIENRNLHDKFHKSAIRQYNKSLL